MSYVDMNNYENVINLTHIFESFEALKYLYNGQYFKYVTS
jgi:hypothetical protein